MTIICGATALYNHERWWLWGPRFPDCVKTPTSGLRVESLSRLRRIRKEPLWQSPSKEEKRENNSAHSPLVHVFTQPGPTAEVEPFEGRRHVAKYWQNILCVVSDVGRLNHIPSVLLSTRAVGGRRWPPRAQPYQLRMRNDSVPSNVSAMITW